MTVPTMSHEAHEHPTDINTPWGDLATVLAGRVESWVGDPILQIPLFHMANHLTRCLITSSKSSNINPGDHKVALCLCELKSHTTQISTTVLSMMSLVTEHWVIDRSIKSCSRYHWNLNLWSSWPLSLPLVVVVDDYGGNPLALEPAPDESILLHLAYLSWTHHQTSIRISHYIWLIVSKYMPSPSTHSLVLGSDCMHTHPGQVSPAAGRLV